MTPTGLPATDEAEVSSGGLTWRDAFRSRLYLLSEKTNADDPGAARGRTLSRIKGNNAGDEAAGIPLKWQNGVFTPDRPSTHSVDRIEQRANKRWLMEAVIRIAESGCAYSVPSNQKIYLPNLLAQEAYRPKRFGERSIKGMFERLVCSDIIVVRQVRDPSKGRWMDRVVRRSRSTFGRRSTWKSTLTSWIAEQERRATSMPVKEGCNMKLKRTRARHNYGGPANG